MGEDPAENSVHSTIWICTSGILQMQNIEISSFLETDLETRTLFMWERCDFFPLPDICINGPHSGLIVMYSMWLDSKYQCCCISHCKSPQSLLPLCK